MNLHVIKFEQCYVIWPYVYTPIVYVVGATGCMQKWNYYYTSKRRPLLTDRTPYEKKKYESEDAVYCCCCCGC
jgi:hypothetical protein